MLSKKKKKKNKENFTNLFGKKFNFHYPKNSMQEKA